MTVLDQHRPNGEQTAEVITLHPERDSTYTKDRGTEDVVEFLSALADLQAELAIADREQLDATIAWLVGHCRPATSPTDLERAAQLAITAERRRICAVHLPELLQQPPDALADEFATALADAHCQDDAELERRRDAALDLALQAPRSLRPLRPAIQTALRAAQTQRDTLVHHEDVVFEALPKSDASSSTSTSTTGKGTKGTARSARKQLGSGVSWTA
jgi:hypothetical protein